MEGKELELDQPRLLRVALLSSLTLFALGGGWHAAQLGAAEARQASTAAPRAEGVARGMARASSLDLAASRTGTSGQSLVLATGIAVTLLDGGSSHALRVPRDSTVSDVLAAAGVVLGPLDRVVSPTDGPLGAGVEIRVVRVTESETVVREPVAFAVSTVADPNLITGKSVVVTAGVPGLAENTYRVRTADGAVEERVLLASVQIQAPVAEVRRVGTQPPPVPGDIESIIRSAATNWGADASQLLRVAYCESRYNPGAYNASSGASGLFQFLPSTWAANSVRAGYGGASVFDAVANANTAAYMFSVGQARQWSCT